MGFPEEKQSLSAAARRLAPPGVFPYNTAPAPPASAMAAWQSIFRNSIFKT
jgi:hypothetical protein